MFFSTNPLHPTPTPTPRDSDLVKYEVYCRIYMDIFFFFFFLFFFLFVCLFFILFFFKFYFIFKLYITVLDLPNIKMNPPYDPAIPLLGIHTEKTRRERDTSTPMFIAALFTWIFSLLQVILMKRPGWEQEITVQSILHRKIHRRYASNAQKPDYCLVMGLQEISILFFLCTSISVFLSTNMYQ